MFSKFSSTFVSSKTRSTPRASTPRYTTEYESPFETPSAQGQEAHVSVSRSFLGTTLSSASCNTQKGSFLVAVVEGTGKAGGEVGLAAMDVQNPHLILAQFPDSTSYTRLISKLEILRPREILVPQTVAEEKIHSMLYPKVLQFFGQPLTSIERKLFNSNNGMNMVKSLCCPTFASVEVEISKKYYSLSAASALLTYIQQVQHMTYAPNSIKVTCTNSEKTVVIDATTAKSLELLVDLNGKLENSLFGFLYHTKTKSGTRMLRAAILEPSRDLNTITARQDCINELSSNTELRSTLEDAIRSIEVDIDLILANMVQFPKEKSRKAIEQRIDTAIFLKHVFSEVSRFRLALSHGKHPLWRKYFEMLDDANYEPLKALVNEYIRDDCEYARRSGNFRVQKCYAVKENLNPLLDVARKTFNENIEDINTAVMELSERHNIPRLRVTHSHLRGYHIECLVYPGCPIRGNPEFIKVTENRRNIFCTTRELIMFNNRVSRAQDEIFKMSSIVIDELLQKLKENIGLIYSLSEIVTKCDFLLSLTFASATYGMVKPIFGDITRIKDGVHPILLKMSDDPMNAIAAPVPNNSYFSSDNNFQIVMGPNMSGKSVYLKQVALLQILAQIGSFVPATSASFRMTDRVMSRIGSDDDIESNCSTFAKELLEAQYIIENTTDSALIVIDELGRGTSEEEGVAICFAIMEHLLQSKAYTIAATHFFDLAILQRLYYNVNIFQFDSLAPLNNQDISYSHKLRQEFDSLNKDYGIVTAEATGFPDSLIADAKALLIGTEKSELEILAQHENDRQLAALGKHLKSVAKNVESMGPNMKEYLKNLKQAFMKDKSTPVFHL
ncbi:MutS -like protein 4 [Halotydeus destructor]|nr:MutS -like protein 4 [Halotydeus destructor]